MSIRKKGNKWQVRFTRKGEAYVRTAPNEVTARVVELLMQISFERGTDPMSFDTPEITDDLHFNMMEVDKKPCGMSVQEGFDELYRIRYANGKSAHSFQVNCRTLSFYFGGSTTDLNQAFTDETIEEFINDQIEEGKKAGTINRKLSLLRQLMAFHKRRIIDPPTNMKDLKDVGERERYLTQEEEEKMLEQFIDDPLMTRYVILSIDTGMRQGELKKAVTGDLDWRKGVIDIPDSKTGKPRRVPLSSRCKKVLQGLRLTLATTPVVPLTYNQIRYRWDRAKKAIGLEHDEKFCPHSMRHTCATRLTKNGVQMALIMKWLGHSNVKTTLKYSHTNVDDLIKVQQNAEQNNSELNGGINQASVS